MKQSELSFIDGFLLGPINVEIAKAKGSVHKTFDWDKAAQIIKDKFQEHSDLVAEAGLQRDWDYTGGVIFADGKPTVESYTYLSSNWAIPSLILSWEDKEQEETECYIAQEGSRFDCKSKWDETSLKILGIDLEGNKISQTENSND